MRAIAIQTYGDTDKLQLMDLPTPQPKPHEVLVRVKAAGVNAVDTYFRDGFLGDGTFPLIMGSDFAGIVEKTGQHVTGVMPGDEVYGYKYMGNGTYAEYAAVDADLLAPKPAQLSFEEAAALPCAGLIAYDTVIDTLALKKGETLLITGASGGVGMVAVQLAKSVGATVIATAGSDNLDFLRTIGADHVIDYTKGDYVKAVRKLCSHGVDAALPAASTTVETVADTVRDHGRLTWITGPQGPRMQRMIAGTFTNGSRGTELLNHLAQAVKSKALHTIHLDHIYSLDQAAAAQKQVRSGHVRGKLVIKI